MPRLDGLAVCRRMRERRDRTPVLMLTARDAVADRVAGLDAGADDYLVKPFALDEAPRACARCCGAPAADDHGEGLGYADLRSTSHLRAPAASDRSSSPAPSSGCSELLLRNPEPCCRAT